MSGAVMNNTMLGFAIMCAAWTARAWAGVWGQDAALLAHSGAPPEPGSYGILSRVHAANVLNELFLLCPVWPAAARVCKKRRRVSCMLFRLSRSRFCASNLLSSIRAWLAD